MKFCRAVHENEKSTIDFLDHEFLVRSYADISLFLFQSGKSWFVIATFRCFLQKSLHLGSALNTQSSQVQSFCLEECTLAQTACPETNL